MTMRVVVLALGLLALAACAPAVTEPAATARHVGSNDPYGNDGARMHLFIFDPSAPRSLADRKAIARRMVEGDNDCSWVEAPDEVLIAATRAQGERYKDTLLVAPLRCRA